MFGGILVLTVTWLSLAGRRRGVKFRQPTVHQRDDIAEPLARIACRHLPMDALGPDFADATLSAAALHDYLLDGPLRQPIDVRNDLPEPDLEP